MNKMQKKILLISLISILTLTNVQSTTAAERYITVLATGSTKVKPDTVRINATTWNISGTNKTALNSTSALSTKLRAVLSANSISKNYIKSSAVTVYPEYNYTQDKGSVLTGYKASQSFEIIVRNAGNAGNLVDAMVGEVGDGLSIEGVTPYIYDQSKASITARSEAVKKARTKANSYAKLLGVNLGKIIYLEEGASSSPTPIMMASAKSDSGSTVIDLGTQDISISITTKWSIN
jgi:uncharacterized protein YggE